MTKTTTKPQAAELVSCPFCGSGEARGPGRYTSASFSGVEVMDADSQPYVWCGTCGSRTRTCVSVAEATKTWNTRTLAAPAPQPLDATLREKVARQCAAIALEEAALDGSDGEIWIAHRIHDRILAALAQPIDAGEDFLAQLRRVNTERYKTWVGNAEDAGMMFDAVELGGEVGELLNVVKKLEREDRGWRGSRADPADFADECADVLICLDKLARRQNVDLAAAVVQKFNATSDKVGLPQRLARTTEATRSNGVERTTTLSHVYGPSQVGHGEAQCIHCLGTNRENAIISPNVCRSRATPADALSDGGGE